MKFFKRKDSSSIILNSADKSEPITQKTCLDYFSTCGKIGKTIIDTQRHLYKKLNKEATAFEVDKQLNKELIKERAIQKYEVDETEFLLDNADWFPRLRTIKIEEDLESVSSADSDQQDGFMGPFSWETKSLQEMEFPPTPEAERKSYINTMNLKNISKKKKRESISIENTDHRTYETLDELRMRLKKNYEEAKQQREKYLNVRKEKTKEEIAEKSINGFRNKKIHQNVYKNYKQSVSSNAFNESPSLSSESSFKRSNSVRDRVPSKSKNLENKSFGGSAAADSFTMELSSAIMKHSSSSGSSLPYCTSTSSHSMKSDVDDMPKNVDVTLSNNDISTPTITSSELTRKNSSKKKRNSSRSSSLRRKNSQRNKTPVTNNNDMSLVMKNSQADGDDVIEKDNDTEKNTESAGLNNVLDMLANW